MYEEGNFAQFKDKIGPYNETTDNNFTANIKIQGISSQFKQWGVSGAGSLIEINYTDSTNKIKTYKTYIRDVSSKDESVLVTSTKYAPKDGTKIESVTIRKTLMTNFDKAIGRGVKIILLIDKSQLDGEIDDKGKSFTGGDITLTGYILSRMGAILYRCTNPLGELHSKSGYFYSQNILISDTTNWSNAGMGSQNKTGPSCSINAETCLVINGNKFDNPNLFRTRVLANFMNTVRMYEYQQICPPPEKVSKGTKFSFGGKTFDGKPLSSPLNWPNSYANCECPDDIDISCKRPKTGVKGTCVGSSNASVKNVSKNCYVSNIPKGTSSEAIEQNCYGTCAVDCCLRYGQKTAPQDKITYNSILESLSSLINWPQFKCSEKGIDLLPLGTKHVSKSKTYIIDPTFDWGTGKRINNDELAKVIKSGNIDGKNLTALQDKNKQGYFCSTKTESICN